MCRSYLLWFFLPSFSDGWRKTPKKSCSLCSSAWSGRVKNSPSSTSTSPTLKVHTHYATICSLEAVFIYLKSSEVVVWICLAIGVTNQRETTLVWDKETGEPLYNAIGKVSLFIHYLHLSWHRSDNGSVFCSVWLDLRTQSTVERLINKTPGRNKNHLKVICHSYIFDIDLSSLQF